MPDGINEVIAADVLENVAGRTRHDGVKQRLVVGIRREHEAPDLGHERSNVSAHLDPRAVWEPYVEDGDVRPRRWDAVHCLLLRTSLAHDSHIALESEEIGKTTPDEFVIVHEEHSDFIGFWRHVCIVPGERPGCLRSRGIAWKYARHSIKGTLRMEVVHVG